jgi:hypothetical protein
MTARGRVMAVSGCVLIVNSELVLCCVMVNSSLKRKRRSVLSMVSCKLKLKKIGVH